MRCYTTLRNVRTQNLQWPRTEWSEIPCKTQPFKTVARKYSPHNVSIILFSDENIFTVAIARNPQNDRLYAHPSTKNKSSAVAAIGDPARESGPKSGVGAAVILSVRVAGSNVAWAKAYLHTKLHPNPSNRLATIHQRHRQTDRQTDIDRTDNGPIAYGKPFYKRSPKNVATKRRRTQLTFSLMTSVWDLQVVDITPVWSRSQS